MARRKARIPQGKKIQPAVMSIQTSLSAGGYQYADLSQMASIVNRRFYRQGLNWAVAGFTIINSGATGTITINSLPNTWVCSNTWEKTFRHWKKQQQEVLDEAGTESLEARFNDFKIFMNAGHHTNGVASNLVPVGSAGVAYDLGEWEYSQIVIPNYGAPGVNYEPYLSMLGADVGGAGGTLGMIRGYGISRSVPHSPDPEEVPGSNSVANWMNLMFDVGDNNLEVQENATAKNNDLPYDQFNYPGETGDQSEFVANIQLANTQSTTGVSGANFPCGLIEFDCSGLSDALKVVIHLVPGHHRGYLAEPMQDM